MKTKTLPKTALISILAAIFVLALALGQVNPGFSQSPQNLTKEIDEAEEDIEKSEERIEKLKKKEDTLKNRLELIKTDIKKVKAELQKTKDEIARVEKRIIETEKEIDYKRSLMQANAKVLYKKGNPSTIEVLFSSDNFTDFINRQEYLDRVKDSLQESARSVVELREQLGIEQEGLEDLQNKQQSKRAMLEERKNEQRQLLKETRGKEAKYQEYIEKRKQELRELRTEQASIIAASQSGGDMVSGETDYPYMHSDCYDDDGRFNGMDENSPCNKHVDPWSFYYHQCTSYVAWRRKDLDREIPAWGEIYPTNAKHFYDRAKEDGYKVNRKPDQGAIAVNRNGEWGHVMIVERVHGDFIDISQFNAGLQGKYSEVHGIPEKQWSNYWFIHDK